MGLYAHYRNKRVSKRRRLLTSKIFLRCVPFLLLKTAWKRIKKIKKNKKRRDTFTPHVPFTRRSLLTPRSRGILLRQQGIALSVRAAWQHAFWLGKTGRSQFAAVGQLKTPKLPPQLMRGNNPKRDLLLQGVLFIVFLMSSFVVLRLGACFYVYI